MKKFFALIAVIFLSVAAASAQNGYGELRSNHSVSTTILGLEYSYEGFVSDQWSLIGRAGVVPVGFSIISDRGVTSFNGVAGIGLSFEGRRYNKKYNSSFFSMRLRANTGGGLEVSFTPAFGWKGRFGKLWFHEFTVGPKIGIVAGQEGFLAPHAQYRIGISF